MYMSYNDNLDDIFDNEVENIENTEEIQTSEDDLNLLSSSIFSEEDEVRKDDNPAKESVISKFLESKGFVDSKVKIIDDSGEESEILFSELPESEQLDVLNSLSTQNTDYSDNEVEWLNELRKNNLSIDEFLELYKQSIVGQIDQNQTTSSYDIDSYTDEELFLLDQKIRYDLSDEELQKVLTKELEDKELFTIKIEKVREEYRQLEEQERAHQRDEFEKQQKQEYDAFVDQMITIAGDINEFHGLELDDTDKNETLSYLLQLDATGTSDFYKELKDPKKIYEAAWYLRHGKDAFRIISEAYEAEISRLKKEKDKPVVVRQ